MMIIMDPLGLDLAPEKLPQTDPREHLLQEKQGFIFSGPQLL